MYWNEKEGNFKENPAIDAFLKDIKAVYKKHNLSIAHEDFQGAFLIENFSCKHNLDWLYHAHDCTGVKEVLS